MINVYIVSGFLGAGKTTFIQKLLKEKKFNKVMLLENEFGEVGVDSAFFDSSLKIREINNGCICCSLQGDFEDALEEIENMGVTDLLIEPSGVGKLSEIINVIRRDDDFRIVSHICIVDVKTCRKYHQNFKEYFDDQVKSANAIILSHTDVADGETIQNAVCIAKELNPEAQIVSEPVGNYSIEELLDIIVSGGDLLPEIKEDEHDHEHHHHDHEHHHEHHHDHEHHHHHDDDDDDEPFRNMILHPKHHYSEEELAKALSDIPEDIIRIKGYVFGTEGMLYFNYVLNEYHIFTGSKKEDALVSVIGTDIDHGLFEELFHD